MRRPDSKEDAELLSDFLLRSVARGADGADDIRPLDSVTALIYFFAEKELAPLKWPEFEGALLQTWRQCGLLKTAVVTDSDHACVRDFSRRFANVVMQVEPRLVAGDINSMSFDCNSKLCHRFDTDYVLIVQNDGFPLRRGLDEFVKLGYDFYGAPHCRPNFVSSLLTRVLRYCPSNGGFSLRSMRLCRLGAKLWQEGGFSGRPYVEDVMAEDYFYTKTLPLSGLGNWLSRSQASSRISDRFSYGATFPLTARALPFGFHTATAFGALVRKFGIDMSCG
jgi:hypothetical protein